MVPANLYELIFEIGGRRHLLYHAAMVSWTAAFVAAVASVATVRRGSVPVRLRVLSRNYGSGAGAGADYAV